MVTRGIEDSAYSPWTVPCASSFAWPFTHGSHHDLNLQCVRLCSSRSAWLGSEGDLAVFMISAS